MGITLPPKLSLTRPAPAAAPTAPNTHLPDGTRRKIGLIRRQTFRGVSPLMRFRRLRREEGLIAQIGSLPKPGEQLITIMDGTFHGWDFVAAVLKLSGVTIAHLRVATLGFNTIQARHLAEMLDAGKIAKATFLVSEYFECSNKGEFNTLRTVLEDRGHRVTSNRNHCKLLLFELSDGRKLAAHGSLNLRTCNAFEQIAIAAGDDLHDFFAAYVDQWFSDAPTAPA